MYDSPLNEVLGVIRFIDTESGEVGARGWMGMEQRLFNRFRVSVLQDEKNSRDGCWRWLCNVMSVFKTSELYTQKDGKIGMYGIIPQVLTWGKGKATYKL